MFENYKATEADLRAVEEGLNTISQPEIRNILRRQNLIKNTLIVSYDSQFLYLWTKISLPGIKALPRRLKKYNAYKIPHKIKIKDEWQAGWQACLPFEKFFKSLPKSLQLADFEMPKISGGLLTPFIKLQKKKRVFPNPYITKESYLATIVHEFAHIYYNQHRLWWYSDKKENLAYLETALKLFENKKTNLRNFKIKVPSPHLLSEIFAFCGEYFAACLFWSNHKRNLDHLNLTMIRKAIPKEKKKNLDLQDSIFDEINQSHLAAAVFGKIILHKYPTSWPNILLGGQFV